MDEMNELPEAIGRMTRDIVTAAVTMTADEARFLVDAYYTMQEGRKRSNNQVRSMTAEPHTTIAWLAVQNETLENQIKRALEKYTDEQPIGKWLKGIYGVGPVIAAGIIAHIDIKKAPTAGHMWRYAGLDPTLVWEKKKKRPWNAELKTLCWKIGQSFMKFSGSEECFYGQVYKQRKAYEIARNDSGANAKTAAEILLKRNVGQTTEMFKHLTSGKLPPAQIDARARRYAVKLFLSHLQTVWWWMENGTMPASPYSISILGHADIIQPPNMPDGMPPIVYQPVNQNPANTL